MKSLGELCDKFFGNKLDINESDARCIKNSLDVFCKTGKKGDAFSVYFCFCEIYNVFGKGYDSMSRLLELLSDHEYHSGELLTRHRDHYSHSVFVFALGLAVYSHDGDFRKTFNDFYGLKNGYSEFLYLWGLTSLFHDVGYPFELAHAQIRAYVEELWGEDFAASPYVSYENMENLLALGESSKRSVCKPGEDLNTACEAEKISKRAVCEVFEPHYKTMNELLARHLEKRFGYSYEITLDALDHRFVGQKKYMDHGYFSAVILSRLISDAGKTLDLKTLDVLTAILLHNSLNRFELAARLNVNTALSSKKHPLAHLLVLCDELQDWNRTAFGLLTKKDPAPWDALFEIKRGKLSVSYLYDSFYVFTPAGKEGRLNGTVGKMQSGEYAADINKLLVNQPELKVVAREKKKEKTYRRFASSDKFVNLCDFAKAIHASYNKTFDKSGSVPEFNELDLETKLSNLEQAKSYDYKLELINCFFSDKELDYPVIYRFSSSEDKRKNENARNDLGFLAREEHLRWVKEKLAAGWKYGKNYKTLEERNKKRINKDIVPYDCLSKAEKKKSEDAIKNMVDYLYSYGHGVRIYSYREGRKPTLNVAGCGHRTIPMDNDELRAKIKAILASYSKDYRVVVRTNFAYGADQLISQCANEMGITIKAALPFPYDEYIAKIKADSKKYNYKFDEKDELDMRHLLAQTVSCKVIPDDKFGYLEASKYIIGKCDRLIAIWDGVPTKLKNEDGKPINQGGTYHNICIAKSSRGLKDEDIHIIHCDR